MKAFLLPPNAKCSGNLLWSICEILNYKDEKILSLEKIRGKGYWASAFPEGDGVVFTSDTNKNSDEILFDFQECFEWLKIEISSLKYAKKQLALIDSDHYIPCTITVPLKQIRIEESCFIANNYKYLASEANDTIEVRRLADFDSEQIEFKLEIKYGDLLQLNLVSLEHDNYVINQCLDYADRGIDIIRFKYSSFEKPEFTPNPAGQVEHGFYEVQISPNIVVPIKTKTYTGISRPLSVSNNWLGPEISPNAFDLNDYKLSELFVGNNKSELGNLVIGSFRNCRQAFYALGEESKFLSLIFSIDGLSSPDKLQGWKHRTYIASLACQENLLKFGEILENYDHLYTDVRNTLVHEGKSFYELEENSLQCCESLWSIYKNIIYLILNKNFTKTNDLRKYAKTLLANQIYIDEYKRIIQNVDSKKITKAGNPKEIKYPVW